MNYSTINGVSQACDTAVSAMLAKGFVCPDVQYWVKSNGGGTLYVGHDEKNGAQLPTFNRYRWGTAEEVFPALFAQIAAQLTVEEARKAEFVQAMAKAIELGSTVGIDLTQVGDAARVEAHEAILQAIRDAFTSSSHLLGFSPDRRSGR